MRKEIAASKRVESYVSNLLEISNSIGGLLEGLDFLHDQQKCEGARIVILDQLKQVANELNTQVDLLPEDILALVSSDQSVFTKRLEIERRFAEFQRQVGAFTACDILDSEDAPTEELLAYGQRTNLSFNWLFVGEGPMFRS